MHSLQFEKSVTMLLDVNVNVGVGKIELYRWEDIVDLERSPAFLT